MISSGSYTEAVALSPLADPDEERLLTRCGHCPATFDGTLGVGRAWYAKHRQQVHPELAPTGPRLRRRRSPSVPGFRNRAAEAASDEEPD